MADHQTATGAKAVTPYSWLPLYTRLDTPLRFHDASDLATTCMCTSVEAE